jgi:hypothetical protein
MMMEHGSTTLRPSSRRQTINSSNCWDWFTRKPSSSGLGISNSLLVYILHCQLGMDTRQVIVRFEEALPLQAFIFL